VSDVRDLLAKMKVADTIKAYKALLDLYSLESGERAVKIRGVLEKVRGKLYEVMNNSFLAFIHDNSKFSKNNFEELGKELSERMPFHWKIDFEGVLLEGGFDVIVGNPPYVEYRNYDPTDLRIINCLKNNNGRKKKEPLFYCSKDCGNTHAYFTERSIKLLRQKGRFGFILPISLVSTNRMDDVRKYIHDNSAEVKYFNFDDRPGKIFSGLEDCRATIIVTMKGKGVKKVTTSKYHRWHTKDRPDLFKDLKTTIWAVKNAKKIVPKLGANMEKRILRKLTQKSRVKTLGDFTKNDGYQVWYHNAPRYWIHAHTEEYLPKIEYYERYEENPAKTKKALIGLRETKISSHYKPLSFDSDNISVANAILNSSLFYWWFVVWSNGRDLLTQQIESFPVNLNDFPSDLKKKLSLLVEELMRNYDETSNEKINVRADGNIIRIREIIPKSSKKIIDRIDDVLAEYFAFSDKERKFIKEFDIKFRM
jgi:hypothetical protein